MPRYSAKARRIKGRGSHSGPAFIQLFHYVKRSTSYHGLSPIARALLIELIDRYNGINNGMIVLGVREASYELGVNQSTVSRAARELDDAGLVRPMKVGAWRGRHATEWRLMWRRCDLTGDLPRKVWQEHKRYVQLLLPKPRKEPLSDLERARRYRRRKAERHADRHDELHHECTEVAPEEHRRDASCTTGAQNGNSSITSRNPSCTREAHLQIYQTPQRDAVKERDE
jgi:DNA-binding transcriptional ArsR family regulator